MSLILFQPFRSHQIGLDSIFAFIFMSNWWFALHDTDYFEVGDAVSPIRHYWSLSIEEQFYFFWPAIIFAVGLLVASKVWSHGHRMRLTGGVMAGIVIASLGWALYQSASSPTWAYFDTFSRIWELGVGALLATAVSFLARVPVAAKPILSWAGVALIAASALLIAEGTGGFPAPWALLPVTGSALVIAAGVLEEPMQQQLLRNRVAVYIGDISYSLYLVHWPVIVFLGALMTARGGNYYVAAVAISFALAIASYHFVENPLRYADPQKARRAIKTIRQRRFVFVQKRSARDAAFAALGLFTIGLSAFALQRQPSQITESLTASSAAGKERETRATTGPLGSRLQQQIEKALKTTEWPILEPSMEQAVEGPYVSPEISCSDDPVKDPQPCTWGEASAQTRIVLVGDSVAKGYAGPLREISLNSNGTIQTYLAHDSCAFVNDLLDRSGVQDFDACKARKQAAVDTINASKPDIVIIANRFRNERVIGSTQIMTPDEWSDSLSQMIDKIRGGAKKIVIMSPPAGNMATPECVSKRSSTPEDCVGEVAADWIGISGAERALAASVGGTWIDSRPWFCANSGQELCPSFVETTPTKRDVVHMTPEYGALIFPVIGEALREAGVLP